MRDLGPEEQRAPVGAIGESASDKREEDQGHELGKTQEAHLQRRSREGVHLVGDRDEGHQAPEEGDELTDEEQAIVPARAEGPQVQSEAPKERDDSSHEARS